MAVNFDANATYGLLPEVVEYLRSWNPESLNPSSIHRGGQRARALLERARDQVREFLDLRADDSVIFTSGATEGNATVLHCNNRPVDGRPPVVWSSSVEHPCISEPLRLAAESGEISHAMLSLSELRAFRVVAERPELKNRANVSLLTVMHANNETGEIFPVAELTRVAKLANPNIRVHSDAVQSVGKIPVSFRQLGVDYLTISGHKLGALPGVGALIVRHGAPLVPLLRGGVQESRLRAGTENLLGIASLGRAIEVLTDQIGVREKQMRSMITRLRLGIGDTIPGVTFQTPLDQAWSLPNTLSVTVPGLAADDLVVGMDTGGFLISSGAACSSGKPEPSPILRHYGLSETDARSTVRFSVRGDCTVEEVDAALARLRSVVLHSRREAA
jgi:cysteine desulfurase